MEGTHYSRAGEKSKALESNCQFPFLLERRRQNFPVRGAGLQLRPGTKAGSDPDPPRSRQKSWRAAVSRPAPAKSGTKLPPIVPPTGKFCFVLLAFVPRGDFGSPEEVPEARFLWNRKRARRHNEPACRAGRGHSTRNQICGPSGSAGEPKSPPASGEILQIRLYKIRELAG